MRILRRQSLLAFGLSLFCTFTAASPLDFDTKSHLAVPGDFNGDGRMDVLMQPLVGDGKGAIILQDGTGQLSVVAQGWDTGYLGLDWSTKESTLTTADLNGDGQDDVLMQPVKAGGTAAVLITDPTVQLLQISQLLPSGYLNLDWSSETHHAVAGDFDGDRHKELFMQATGPGGLGAIAHADQMGNIVAITQTFVDGYLGRHWNSKDETLYVGDFNGDGRQDLLVQSHGAIAGESAYALLLADGNGQFTRIAQTWNLKDLGANWNPASHKLIVEDANHDGIMDIVLQSTVKGGTNYVFEGNAQGLFMQPAAHWTGDKSAADALAASTGNTKSTTNKTNSTGIKISSIGGMTANTISGPTDPEPNPIPVHGGSQAQGSGQIMTVSAAGALQGSGGVSGGTATYSIPIPVPPGIAGMQPSVSLNYSSRGGNGEMGMGWSVSAGSQIHRCPATTAMDGYASGVTYSATNDRLCLDGQHLILVSGTYGANQAHYRTEQDAFTLVIQVGLINSATNSQFTVLTKNGHTITYGGPGATFTASGVTTPLAWGISTDLDTYNNSIFYNYNQSSHGSFGPGEYLLTSIQYTGTATTAGNREVDFYYNNRTDVTTQYLASGLTAQTQILSSISTSEAGSQVQTYTAEYTSSGATNRTLLAGVQECGFTSGTQSCLPETTFSWQNAPTAFSAPASLDIDPVFTPTSSPSAVMVSATGDFDGDGRKDIVYDLPGVKSTVYFLNSNGTVKNSADISSLWGSGGDVLSAGAADIDDDGAADIFGFEVGTGKAEWFAYSSYNTSTLAFNPAKRLPIPANYIVQGYSYSSFVGLIDVDGDGLADLVVLIPDTTNSGYHDLVVYLNQPNSCSGQYCPFSSTPTVLFSVADYTDTANNVHVLQASPVGDLDGNGLPDFAVDYYDASGNWHQSWIFPQVNTHGVLQAPFTPVLESTAGISVLALDTRTNPHLMDINGDGLPDMVYDCSLSNHDWCYQLNTGGTFSKPVDSHVPDLEDPIGSLTGDLDNDGVQELMYPVTMLVDFCMTESNLKTSDGNESDLVCVNPADSAVMGKTLSSSQDRAIYKYGRYKFVPQADSTTEDGSGYRYSPQYALTNIIGQKSLAVAMDVMGDGLTGLVSAFSKTSYQAFFKNLTNTSFPHGPGVAANAAGSGTSVDAAPDLMLSSVDGFGRKEQWDYYPLSSPVKFNSIKLYYSPGTGGNGYAGGDYFYFASSMYVVGDYSVSSGVGPTNTHDFHYAQAIYNNQGRGFQGFRTVVDDDMVTGARTVQIYHQRFPISGQLQESWTTLQDPGFDLTDPVVDGNAISHVTTTVGCYYGSGARKFANGSYTVDPMNDPITCKNTLDAPTYMGYVSEEIVHKQDTGGNRLSDTTTDYTYDLYGNVTDTHAVVTDDQGVYTSDVTDAYTSNPSSNSWWLDQLNSKTTTVDANYSGNDSGSISRTTSYDSYDSGRSPTQITELNGDPLYSRISTYAYTVQGNVKTVTVTPVTQSTPARQTQTTYSSGADNGYFVYSVTDPAGLTTTYTTIDQRFGLPTTVVAPDGATTSSTYDSFGRKITSQLGSLPAQNIAYITSSSGDGKCDNIAGLAVPQYYVLVNQTGYPSHYDCYDMFNRVIRSAHENLSDQSVLVFTDKVYDVRGRVKQVSEPYFNAAAPPIFWNVIKSSTDILGRVIEKDDAKGVVTQYGYTGLVTDITTTPCATGASGCSRLDEEVTNSLGKLITVTNAKGDATAATTSYGYDSDGNPVAITAADGSLIKAGYNIIGQKEWVQDADLQSFPYTTPENVSVNATAAYTYDVFGDLLTQTDAKSQVLTMGYDNDGRMLTKGSSGTAVLEPAVVWTYDNCTHGAGKLCTVAVADKSYSEAYTYTALGMVKSDIETIGGTPTTAGTQYETDTDYDSYGRIALVSYPYTSVTDQPPVANAGATQYVWPGASVTLNGSATDADNGPDPLGYQWTQTAGPTINLSSTSIANPGFTATTTLGTTYSFQLMADDGLLTSTASVNVVVPNAPAAPATPTDDGDTNHDGVYTVSWSGVSVPGTNILYHLEEATGTASAATGTWKECYVGSTPSVSIDHSGNSYYYYWYRVRAEDQISGHSVGYSGYSGNDSIHVVVKPGSPSSISPGTGTTTTGTYNISWGSATGGVVTADIYYQLFVSSSSSFSSTSMVYTGVARSQSFTNAIGDYYYEVRACNTNANVTECSGYTLKAHEIVLATTPPPGGPGGPTQPQIVVQIKPVPAPVTSVGPTGSLVPVSPILPQLQEVRRTETLDGSAREAKGREWQLVAEVQGRTNAAVSREPRAATASSNVSGYVRPKFAPPVYKAWADAKLQDATTTAQVVRFSVQYLYSGNGYLEQLADGVNPNRVYWSANVYAETVPTQVNPNETFDERGMDAYGHVTDVIFGNSSSTGVSTHYGYDATTSYLDSIKSTSSAGAIYQNLAYSWQALGNLQKRTSSPTTTLTLSESFTYDMQNRLATSQVSNGNGAQPGVNYAYDGVGDITCRSDVTGHDCSVTPTGYGYGPTANSPIAGPHALTSTTGGTINGSYSYDADGNMTCRSYTGACSPSGQNITWNSDNLATSITQGGYTSSFSYAPDKHRYKQVATMAGGTETTIYAGGLEQITDVTGATQYRVTLSAYGRPVFLDTLSLSGSIPKENQRYLLTDHLGSVDTVVDSSLTVQPQESFDTFGKRRDSGAWYGSPTPATVATARAVTHRGFTHHEHLDNLTVTDGSGNTIDGVLDANGRMLDPVVGRFLSVDPVFQAPSNSQSVNPYSYVMNNPLSLSDPSGYESACPDQSLSGCSGGQNSDSNTTKTSATDVGSHIAHHGDTTTTTTTEANGNKVVSHSGNGFGMGETASVSMDGDNGATHGMTGTTMPSASNAGGSANQGSESQKPTTTNAGDRNLSAPCEDPSNCGGGTSPTSGGTTGQGDQQFVDPTGKGERGRDAAGNGDYQAPRTSASGKHYGHQGEDYLADAGQKVVADISGKVTRVVVVYTAADVAHDPRLASFRGVEIVNPETGFSSKLFYVSASPGVVGTIVHAGDPIGTAQDRAGLTQGMQNHVHVEIRQNNQLVDPRDYIHPPN